MSSPSRLVLSIDGKLMSHTYEYIQLNHITPCSVPKVLHPLWKINIKQTFKLGVPGGIIKIRNYKYYKEIYKNILKNQVYQISIPMFIFLVIFERFLQNV